MNVGSVTVRSKEVSDVVERRKVDILYVQETRREETKQRILPVVRSCNLVETRMKEEGESIIEFAVAFDMAINIFTSDDYATYSSEVRHRFSNVQK